MEMGTLPQPSPAEALVAQRRKLQADIHKGAAWFYWIAGLSLVNTLLFIFGANINFLLGLGATQLITAIALGIGDAIGSQGGMWVVKLIALGASVVIAAGMALFGYFSAKGNRWLFLVGMILYALDALLLLAFHDWAGFLFHLLALWGLYTGLRATSRLEKLGA